MAARITLTFHDDESGTTVTRAYVLGEASITIGRSPDCSIPISNVCVRWVYLTLQQLGPMWTVHIHSSVNKTWLNGSKLNQIQHGNELRGGDVKQHTMLLFAMWETLLTRPLFGVWYRCCPW
jgi:pSer/pThr/pTyr-binding forkhead associated (FHA) protein